VSRTRICKSALPVVMFTETAKFAPVPLRPFVPGTPAGVHAKLSRAAPKLAMVMVVLPEVAPLSTNAFEKSAPPERSLFAFDRR
jgi:hypothetical protein